VALAALIFDVDGTLAETEELHRRAFNESFAEAGLPWIWDVALYRRLLAVTGGKERIRYFIDRFGGMPDLQAAAIVSLHEAKTRRYAELVAAGALTLRPGVERLLREAHQADIRLAIATTTTPANIEALLGATLGGDWRSLFAAVKAGDSVTAKKPAPDVYRLVLDTLDLRAADCVAFEDTRNGLISARVAGIPTVVTLSDYGDTGPFPGAVAVVDHLGEPDKPCTVLAGGPVVGGYVDLRTLARWRNVT
jgi:beta-phosphoglucomutase-like phosphatase (HAD superfamily)